MNPKHSQIALSEAFLAQKVAKSMTKAIIQSPNGFQPGSYLSSPTRAIKDHPSTREHLTGPRKKPQEKQTAEQCMHKLLVN